MKQNKMYVGSIIKKFMSESEMDSFVSKYNAHKHRRAPKNPSKNDFIYFDEYKKKKLTVAEIARNYGASPVRVKDGVLRVAMSKI